jgi:hypothetical protein
MMFLPTGSTMMDDDYEIVYEKLMTCIEIVYDSIFGTTIWLLLDSPHLSKV